jgi:alkylation response protein AidB-like acyl-CoA dehydrogenase
MLIVSAIPEGASKLLVAAIPSDRPGVRILGDWDAFGQRQTDSGNVHFSQVHLPRALVLQAPGVVATPQATLRSQVAQLIMANLYLGIGQGAFDTAVDYTRNEARAWFASGVGKAGDDPFIQHRYGELYLLLAPAEALADRAAETLEKVYRKGALITAQDRGDVAIAVATAKCLAHRAGVDISNQMFELMGARATSQRYGYDRFWRNARVHTLHDPIDYKLRDLGRYALDGSVPEPTAYS